MPEPAKAPLNTKNDKRRRHISCTRSMKNGGLGGELICKYRRERENGGNYQRALTLLNEAVGILTSPATATDASDHQPHLSQQSAVTAQVSSERREMARLFPFYRQGATAAGMRTSSRQPFKRFRPSASASGLKKAWKPKETWTHTFVCIGESDQWLIPSREENIILKEAGLGEKRITFDKYGDYEHFHSSLLKEFPKLSEGGAEDFKYCDLLERDEAWI